MIIYLQFNDDTEHRVALSYFEENMNFSSERNNVDFLRCTLNCHVDESENFPEVQANILEYCSANTVSSVKFIRNDNIIYTSSTYSKINSIFVRPDENGKILFTINFEQYIDV